LSGYATGGRLPPGRQGKATIHEPGDLPSAVSTRQTPVGVHRWMIQRTKVFWSSLAPATGGRSGEVFFVLNFLKSAVDDASANQRAKISAIYIVLLAASALVWIWALIALAGRPTLLGTAFLA
jgi:hypothetical protein